MLLQYLENSSKAFAVVNKQLYSCMAQQLVDLDAQSPREEDESVAAKVGEHVVAKAIVDIHLPYDSPHLASYMLQRFGMPDFTNARFDCSQMVAALESFH